MKKITYTQTIPPKQKYWDLFQTTGWNDKYQATPETLIQTIVNSSFYLSAYDGDQLVGFGRVLSDGCMHAMIFDLIIIPPYQGRGIGSEILTKLVEKCLSMGIGDIQLFSAKGKAGFYEKHGFVIRPEDAPGMEYSPENVNQ